MHNSAYTFRGRCLTMGGSSSSSREPGRRVLPSSLCSSCRLPLWSCNPAVWTSTLRRHRGSFVRWAALDMIHAGTTVKLLFWRNLRAPLRSSRCEPGVRAGVSGISVWAAAVRSVCRVLSRPHEMGLRTHLWPTHGGTGSLMTATLSRQRQRTVMALTRGANLTDSSHARLPDKFVVITPSQGVRASQGASRCLSCSGRTSPCAWRRIMS